MTTKPHDSTVQHTISDLLPKASISPMLYDYDEDHYNA